MSHLYIFLHFAICHLLDILIDRYTLLAEMLTGYRRIVTLLLYAAATPGRPPHLHTI